jgi:hypothetical protein
MEDTMEYIGRVCGCVWAVTEQRHIYIDPNCPTHRADWDRGEGRDVVHPVPCRCPRCVWVAQHEVSHG